MLGIFTLHHFGKVKLHIKPTKLAPNILGGLLFGVGFALIGYRPGQPLPPSAREAGISFGMAGLVAGSWLFAEMSGTLKQTIEKWGDLGKIHSRLSFCFSEELLMLQPSGLPVRRR